MTKKLVKILIAIITLSLTISLSAVKTYAIVQDSAPYPTYTVGSNGLILTQTAYEPTGKMTINESLNAPQDMFIKDGIIYVADTGNQRIIKVNSKGEILLKIENINQPTGIHVDSNNNIYVADKGSKLVIKYDELGNEIQRFGRPTAPLFGDALYEPKKIVSGPRDILYIVGEGSTNGLIQLNSRGEFLGFFGTNPTTKSFWQSIADIFNVGYARTIPVSPDNVAIDEKGSVFTVSKTSSDNIKKFNISSSITLSMHQEDDIPVAVKVNDFGNIYSISETGVITEYDSYGNLIFMFGGLDTGNEVLGRFVKPADIEIDANNNLYILDTGSNAIHILVRTEFAGKIHQGLNNYKNGIYDIEEWREVLQMNSFFALANKSIANALYRNNQYDEALAYFRLANDREGYSDAFWQVRYDWLQSNLAVLFIVIISAFVLVKVLKIVDKKHKIYDPIRAINDKVKNQRIVKESSYLRKILKNPADTVYSLKRERKSSVLTATIIYVVFAVLTLISLYTTGFIFNTANGGFGALREVAITVGVIALFIVANHLISSLQSGEGWFRDIYIGIAYALAPVLISIVPLILLSHVLTINEIFIYSVAKTIAWAWAGILVIIVIKEVHNYTVKELIVNLLLTIFTMLMIILIGFLVYLLSVQLFDYFGGLIREVILRV
ncbi:YIP1 family protein [Haploplasma axanthum]|uniref:Serine/threonine-protein kinase pknD n=1 Tax=Haploplasma axanthum TaxID=29552 RepID=A0A449BFK5_HAPAX|nr:YIP1 family protein [Haploplasma axanthum]VEU81216.1 Serine/threonine-protein kinase pknD [Haploplasma axanthum]